MTQMMPRLKRKGEATRAAILESALESASAHGLEGLTIGSLAEQIGMSKSGVFSHFGSREELQIAVIKLYHHRFEQEIFYPSLQEARGLPRLKSMFRLWIHRVSQEIALGCIYISGAIEYDDRQGIIRDELVKMVTAWQDALKRAVLQAVELQHLQKSTNPEQLIYEIHGIILSLHHDIRFLKKPNSLQYANIAFERMINSYLSK